MDVLRDLDRNGVNQFGSSMFSEIARHAASHGFITPLERGREPLVSADEEKARELFWSFIIQGILIPGLNSGNPNLPFFTLTEYGRHILSSPDPTPHDPDGYLKHLKHIVPSLDPVVMAYVNEGLDCFLRGNYTASVVMLGVANEKLILDLAQTLQQALTGEEATNIQKVIDRENISRIYEGLKKRLIPRIKSLPSGLGDALEGLLDGVFAIIRIHRNQAGHPTGQFFDRLTALGLYSSFPFYCERVSQLTNHIMSNPF